MSLWTRLGNSLRGNRVNREIDEELASHLEEAAAQGRDPAEARRTFGSLLRQREASRDVRVVAWLDSLRADSVFGWRQLRKNRVTSTAAILSLALAIGSCTSAFRLVDALLLRPLPVAHPERLYALSHQGFGDAWDHTAFRQMRDAVNDQAELIAISSTGPMDVAYGSDREMEKANLQFVSGRMFPAFGLQPAAGRLFAGNDDLKPGAHPVAVLSYDYWARRFGKDPGVIGRTFRTGRDWRIGEKSGVFEIVGVAGEGFSGTEPGAVNDIFVPTMMHNLVNQVPAALFRVFAILPPGVAPEPVRERLRAVQPVPKNGDWSYPLLLEPAAAGASRLQQDYFLPLAALGVLVTLVLFMACANVANLLIAQAAARAREMALRVSIGAGRSRLVQLVLVESALLAFLGSVAGALFAWWAAPFVAGRINPPNNPARLSLAADWRVLGFGVAVTLGVTFLFGLVPALRASRVTPASALRGGEDPRSRRRVMHVLTGVQAAFCFLVLFVAGLFAATFTRLSHQSMGISSERVLNLDVVTPRHEPEVLWDQVAERLRSVPGVETVAFADWPLLDAYGYKTNAISINGAPPSDAITWFMNVSPGWIETMKISLLEGRDFRAGDQSPGVAIVNEAFAERYFGGKSPVGSWFEGTGGYMRGQRFEIVGMVGKVGYRYLRQPVLPVAFTPFDRPGDGGTMLGGTFVVRTSGANPLALASTLRREVAQARPEFRVSLVRTQAELEEAQTVRERLLAMLGLFFSGVALLLAGVGLYGVLDYSVVQRRREIGIRVAIGAPSGSIARLVTVEIFAMVVAGAVVGVGLSLAAVRYVATLLYQVKPTEPGVLAIPALTILAAAALAAVPGVVRAMRIDPVSMLRVE
jgi:putative ABC transport system permease protein